MTQTLAGEGTGVTPGFEAPSDSLAQTCTLAVLGTLPSDVDVAVVRDGDAWLVGVNPEQVLTGRGEEGFSVLDRLDGGWWAGFLAYDLGRAIENVISRAPEDPNLPDVILARFEARLVITEEGLRVEGGGRTRPMLEAIARGAARGAVSPCSPSLGPWISNVSRTEFEADIRTVIALIEAGECYQVNLTRRLSCPMRADPIALFAGLLRRNPAPHAALLRLGQLAVVSASPERFLYRRGSYVETRPIKGTAADAQVLEASMKDRAENVMIVDLARNDLGRVCQYGSVSVPSLCRVEQHPGLHHLVSTVVGELRPDVGTGGLLRATFPPASVTGAPKPRVLQAIEDLESSRRGVYCGAIGWIDADGDSLGLNVAIRTFVVSREGTQLGVGAGIVADSDPSAEWEETELKVARLLHAVASGS